MGGFRGPYISESPPRWTAASRFDRLPLRPRDAIPTATSAGIAYAARQEIPALKQASRRRPARIECPYVDPALDHLRPRALKLAETARNAPSRQRSAPEITPNLSSTL